jgi:hypothetical protein
MHKEKIFINKNDNVLNKIKRKICKAKENF